MELPHPVALASHAHRDLTAGSLLAGTKVEVEVEGEVMGYSFPSAEWTAAFKDAVNANEAYRTAGAEWTHGPVAMVVSKGTAPGLEDDVAMLLDVEKGSCREAKYVHGLDAVRDAPFIIVAPYERWKSVIAGEIDPIKGMMQGKLKLTKGHLPTMLKFVESSRQLVASASHVDTDFAS